MGCVAAAGVGGLEATKYCVLRVVDRQAGGLCIKYLGSARGHSLGARCTGRGTEPATALITCSKVK